MQFNALDDYTAEKMLDDYFEISETDGISFFRADLGDERSCAVKLPNGKYVIGIDFSQIHSSAELRSALGHELGHCKTNSFYGALASRWERNKAEYQAVRWAVMFCVPFAAYIDAIRSGVRDIWALSEYFDITVASAKKVAEFYESRFLDYIRMAKEVTI